MCVLAVLQGCGDLFDTSNVDEEAGAPYLVLQTASPPRSPDGLRTQPTDNGLGIVVIAQGGPATPAKRLAIRVDRGTLRTLRGDSGSSVCLDLPQEGIVTFAVVPSDIEAVVYAALVDASMSMDVGDGGVDGDSGDADVDAGAPSPPDGSAAAPSRDAGTCRICGATTVLAERELAIISSVPTPDSAAQDVMSNDAADTGADATDADATDAVDANADVQDAEGGS